jgi:hypothetical protein
MIGPGGRRRRALFVGAALILMSATLAPSTASLAAAPTGPGLTESAMTLSGQGRFADLDVTVGKTKALGNEAVRVSWQWKDAHPGQHATVSETGWGYNYFSVFQCWGDDPTGPTREQCEFGGQFNDTDAGVNHHLSPFNTDPDKAWALSRAVSPVDVFGHTVAESKDPREYTDAHGYPAQEPQPGVFTPGIVPMHASPSDDFPNGETETSIDTASFFDIYGTNEVPLARTNGDGSGQVYFETQTVYESQFLGCGARLHENPDGTAEARKCWLVVVPRDSIEVDGADVSARQAESEKVLYSSPLSLSNWANRITFPLDFEPVRVPCKLGGVERPVIGHESLSVAISSWQGPLCTAGQGYFYATTTDDIARSTAASQLPKLSVVTDPLPPDAVPPSQGGLEYAPLAASGVSISFFIERFYAPIVDEKYRVYNGTRVEQLNLTPRLVAKLLTQSYRYSTVTINGGPAHLAKAPLSLIDDPDFLAVNKFTNAAGDPDLSRDLAHLSNQRDSLAKIFVTADDSDAIRLTWEWIVADPAARAFLAGKPDPYGMKINPFYKGIDKYIHGGVPLADIPRLDDVCINATVGNSGGQVRPVCPLDAAPYVGSLDSGAALTGRGQPAGTQSFTKDFSSGFIKPDKASPQLVGQRALIALTDTPSSNRRGLVAASLRNASGHFVAPTSATMSAALSQAAKTKTAGVLRVASEKVRGGGYPLTRISYGVTNAALLNQEARNDYADFTKFAATNGQIPGTRPGQLPVGYAPLTKAMTTQALKASKQIRTATAPKSTPTPTPSSSFSSSAGSTADANGPVATPGPAASPSAVSATPTATPTSIGIRPVSALTPSLALGLLRWILPGLAALGIAALISSRLIMRRGPLLPPSSSGSLPPVTTPPSRKAPQ